MANSRNYIKLDEKVNAITSIPPSAKYYMGKFALYHKTTGAVCIKQVFCKAVKLVHSIGE